ncbi:PREDICTED: tumor necrosis factor receptor superfamily member 21-like isoform X1 [Branchiostoma belcheri]|uniref:Tumor necrosis factor receptor superfamily member 21-like isoform X1 n=1 Tax=Branchiostoma belcheri TaxID=7741 RepID=A0A6P5A6B6_BRABE|nr:PREDICTED: tumor necrosis factor receptor superfamily member 21-like isoform X1 [Branchiostoma belcheri]
MYCRVILALGATVLAGVVHGDGQDETLATPPPPWAHNDPLSGKTLLCDWCPPGQHMSSPCTERSQTECVPCGENGYAEFHNHLRECRLCKACHRHHEHESQNCTPTTKTECECDPGYYLSGDVCTAHSKCPVKYGVKQQGTPTSNTKCERCDSGTFSDVLSSTEGCKNHTDCGDLGLCLVDKGNRRKDNICGNCTTNGTVVIMTTVSTPKMTTGGNSSTNTANSTAASKIATSTDESTPGYIALGCICILLFLFVCLGVVKRRWIMAKCNELLGRTSQDRRRQGQSQVDSGVTMQPLMNRSGHAHDAQAVEQLADYLPTLGCCPIRSSPRLRRGVSRNDENVRSQMVTTDDTNAIAADIGNAWRPLGRRLGFSDGKLDGFENDYRYLQEIVHQMLRQWVNENREEATRGKLADALVEVEKEDVARTLLGLAIGEHSQ